MSFVESETLSVSAIMWFLRDGFMSLTAYEAVLLFDLEICLYLNKNCLLRLEFSIWSGSVRVILPFYPVPKPIIAKFFKSSHPMAPEPIMNSFISLIEIVVVNMTKLGCLFSIVELNQVI